LEESTAYADEKGMKGSYLAIESSLRMVDYPAKALLTLRWCILIGCSKHVSTTISTAASCPPPLNPAGCAALTEGLLMSPVYRFDGGIARVWSKPNIWRNI